MKKKLNLLIAVSLLAVFCLLIVVITALPFNNSLADGEETPGIEKSKTQEMPLGSLLGTEPLEVLDADDSSVQYEIKATTTDATDPVIIGPNRQKTLQDGETYVMKFTVVSQSFSGMQNGMILTKRGNVSSESEGSIAWYHNGGGGYTTSAADVSYTAAGQTDSKGITNPNESFTEIFKNGNEVKAEFTPAQSNGELGVFVISYRTSGSESWTIGVRASDISKEVSRDAQIWLWFNGSGTSTLTVKDYSITTSHGANLLSSGDGKEDEDVYGGGGVVIGKMNYDGIGNALISNSSSYTCTPIVASSYEKVTATSTTYLLAPFVTIPSGEKLVQQFEVVEGFTGDGPYRFGVVMHSATNAYVDGGNIFQIFSQFGGDCHVSSAFGGTGSSPNSAYSVSYMKPGSIIKLEYSPDEGTFNLLSKNADEDEFKARFVITNMDPDQVQRSVLMGIRMDSGGGSWTVQNFAYKNYTQYTENLTTGEKTVLYDSNVKGHEDMRIVTSSASLSTVSNTKEVAVSTDEYKLTFGGLYFGRGSVDYVANVKKGESYTLPVKPYGFDGQFIVWGTPIGYFHGGETITPTSDITVNPIGVHINEMGAELCTVNELGLQFGSSVNYDEYVALDSFNGDYGITTGTIIVPESYIGTVGLTLEELQTSGKAYLNLVNEGFADTSDGKSGGHYDYYGAIVEILANNLARNFVAVSYLTVEFESESITVYSDIHEAENVYNVAKSAYAGADEKLKASLEDLYLDKVVEIVDGSIVTIAGYVSPYTIEGGKLRGDIGNISIVFVDGVKYKAASCGYIN